jgi:hypothetical protein
MLRLPAKRLLPQLDVDTELNRHNASIAQYFIIAGLIKGDTVLRNKIINSINPVSFFIDSFEQYLFVKISEILKESVDYKISTQWITSQIKGYFKEIWNSYPTRHELHSKLFSCAQILDFSPSAEQVLRSIELCKYVATMTGLS